MSFYGCLLRIGVIFFYSILNEEGAGKIKN